MPVYMTPRFGDCSRYNSLDCAESYKHGELLSDEVGDFIRPEIPPEETEDYIEANERYETHLQLMGEALTVFDLLYWKRAYFDMKELAISWSNYMNGKLVFVGKELIACILTGGIVLGVFCLLLRILGPIRMKTLGYLIVASLIGSIFATESTEIATSVLIGVTLVLFIFFTKISSGERVLRVKNRSLKNKLAMDDSLYVFFDFWYMGNRTIWINLSNKVIGIL